MAPQPSERGAPRGAGRRLFDNTDSGHIELELVRRLADRDVTHLRYRVL